MLLLSFVCLCFAQVRAQEDKFILSQAHFLLQDSLQMDALREAERRITPDTTKGDTIIMQPDSSLQWRYLFSHQKGYHQSFPGLSQKIDNFYVPDTSIKTLSTRELIRYFHFEKIQLARDSAGNIKHSPMIMTGDRQYLIVYSGHCYPHGSQTSWCYDFIYYFERVE